jgi:hypothetical protein
MELAPAEIAHLEQLPDAAHQVEPEVECLLGVGHAGPHVSLGQTQDGGADIVNWWLRWSDDGGREWTHEAHCPAESGDDVCLLPAAHEGGHRWG